jgi:ribosomal protein L34
MRVHARRTTAHGRAVLYQSGGGIGVSRKNMRSTSGRKVIRHGRPKQRAVGPLRHGARRAFDASGVQGFIRAEVLQHIADECGVANDVVADLQHGDAAVTARERLHVGLGHHHGLVYRLPTHVLVAKDGAHFFGEGGVRVVVKVQVLHGVSPELCRLWC